MTQVNVVTQLLKKNHRAFVQKKADFFNMLKKKSVFAFPYVCNNFFFPLSPSSQSFALSFVGILTPSRPSGVCGPAFKPYHLGNTLDAMATCFFFHRHPPPPLPQPLLSVSNSPLQTQLTNPALLPCAGLFATRCAHAGGVQADMVPTKGNLGGEASPRGVTSCIAEEFIRSTGSKKNPVEPE